MARTEAVVAQYVDGTSGHWECGMDGCTTKWGQKQFPGSRAADHIYCECAFASPEARKTVGDGHNSMLIKQKKMAEKAAATARVGDSKI